MAQRANARDAGLLVERARVERGMYDVMRAYRDAVMVVGQRSAPRCIGLADARDAIELLARAKAETGGGVEAFELMRRLGMEFVLRHIPDSREPL